MTVEDILFAENNQLLTIMYLMSAVLCSGIAVFFFKLYRSFPSSYVVGLLVGFAFISSSDLLFASTVGLATVDESFNALHWINLFVGLTGFVIIGSVYVFQKLDEKKFSGMTKLTTLSLLPITLILLYVLAENVQIPSFTYYNEYFRFASVLAIGYATFSILLNKNAKSGRFSILALGFIVLLVSQCFRAFFAIEPTLFALYAAGSFKVGSFAIILFALTRKPKTSKSMEKHEK